MSPQPPVVATIAGADSGGAAGLAADLKSFAAHGVHGVFALTMITAQNTRGIHAVEALSREMVEAQIDALVDDYTIAATKTGLLYTEHAVAAVLERVESLGRLVVDPVLVRSSGEPLVSPDVLALYRNHLLGAATVITPNVAEASLLAERPVDSVETALAAADALCARGVAAVVVTGVEDGREMVDVFMDASGQRVLRHPSVETKNLLGTGCSFAASIVARLALGDALTVAVDAAREFVHDGLRAAAAWRLGSGQGPIDHLSRFR